MAKPSMIADLDQRGDDDREHGRYPLLPANRSSTGGQILAPLGRPRRARSPRAWRRRSRGPRCSPGSGPRLRATWHQDLPVRPGVVRRRRRRRAAAGSAPRRLVMRAVDLGPHRRGEHHLGPAGQLGARGGLHHEELAAARPGRAPPRAGVRRVTHHVERLELTLAEVLGQLLRASAACPGRRPWPRCGWGWGRRRAGCRRPRRPRARRAQVEPCRPRGSRGPGARRRSCPRWWRRRRAPRRCWQRSAPEQLGQLVAPPRPAPRPSPSCSLCSSGSGGAQSVARPAL